MLLGLLAGYFVFNKPFAILGYGNIHPGEVTLAILLIVSVLHFREIWLSPLKRSWLSRMVFAYLLYGSARVFIDALRISNESGTPGVIWAFRDGVSVGYALFAFVGSPILASATTNAVERLSSLLLWVSFPALLWTLLTITNCWPTTLDYFVFNRKVDMLSLSVAVAAWVLGVLAISSFLEKSSVSRWRHVVLMGVSALISAAVALRIPIRAAWIAGVVVGMAMLLVTFPRWINRYVLTLAAVAVLATGFVALPYVQNSDSATAETIRMTLFGGNPYYLKTQAGKNAIAHLEWRQKFWQRCIQKTSENAPVFGLGFGSNLTDLMRDTPDWYRYIESQQLDPPNRSPHNATVTIYARLGLVGLALWLGILLGTFVKGVRYCRAGLKNSTADFYAGLTVFGTWLIYLAYMSVGVVLENPFGGIWFWVLTGALHALPPPKSAAGSPSR